MTENIASNDNPDIRSPKATISKRIDWATTESGTRHTSEDTEASRELDLPPRDIFKTPPPKTNSVESSNVIAHPSINDHPSSIVGKKTYNIATLMEYRGSLSGISVFAKIKPEALADNLFPYISGYHLQQPPARTRGLSQLSNAQRGMDGTRSLPSLNLQRKFAGTPDRQPLGPPDKANLQQHAGFVRFLKQHASPPHHRVTAGGRIVPTGPYAPPPMFDYASLTGMNNARRETFFQQSLREQGSTHNGRAQSAWNVPQTSPLDFQFRTADNFHPMISPNPGLQNNFLSTSMNDETNDSQYPAPNLSAQSSSFVPIGSLEDGSLITSCNGTMYRMYWNGTGTVVEPLSALALQSPLATQTELSAQPRTTRIQRKSNTVSQQIPREPRPLANTTNQSRVSSLGSRSSQHLKDLGSQHLKMLESRQNVLKAELHELDRNIALRHYELKQEQRVTLISQRRSLVEEIDKIRRIKEPSSQDLPIVSVKDLERRAIHRRNLSRSSKALSPREDRRDNANMREQAHDLAHKPLSPNAPPFIPSNSKLSPVNVEKNRPVARIHHESSLGLLGQALPGMPDSAPTNHFPELAEHAHIRRFAQDESPRRIPSDPAMKTIHKSDILYAAIHETNIIDGQKRFCTTVPEFQEAIKRVRQQARLYGCAGGSSKDPAYDAEQDIWWAICDKDPIPFPSETPDHVSHPRPWDWNDSAFNYRRDQEVHSRSIAPLPGNDFYHDERNSTTKRKPLDIRELLPYVDPNRRALRNIKPKLEGSWNVEEETHPDESRGLKASKQLTHDTLIHPEIQIERAQLNTDTSNKSKNNRAEVAKRRTSTITRDDLQKLHSETFGLATKSEGTQKDRPIRSMEDHQASFSVLHDSDAGLKTIDQPAYTDQTPEVLQPKNDVPKASAYNESVKSQKSEMTLRRIPSKHKVAKAIPLREQRHAFKKSSRDKKSVTDSENTQATSVSSDIGAKLKSKRLREKGQRNLISRTTQQLSPRAAAKKAKELYERSRSKSPLKRQPNLPAPEPAPGPRVNLPPWIFTAPKRESAPNAFLSNEVKSNSVSQSTNDTFLRDMLRGGHFSFAHTKAKPPEIRSPTLQPALAIHHIGEHSNKENEAGQLLNPTAPKISSLETMSLPISEHHGLLPSKAASSLASSSYHASGFLPQYDGAGKSQTSNVHQQHGASTSHRQAKVNLPSSSSYESAVTPLGEISHNQVRGSLSSQSKQTLRISRPPVPFGFDGSADELSGTAVNDNQSKPNPSTAAQITEADYLQRRADPNNDQHYKEVDAFFNKIAEEEKDTMARRLRQNTKTD
ncbi:uncharacterized protein KY384_007904 [Bacidia gigantensis]|uniref:uncharacterized protein n=1 Tax=Bacidia gigantensis TaxID=2732470 RepID=UPI001D03B2D2|nr:uncharacterized protein KY384_007904 [Bacidia gigantensis]KAG8527750.1 hypothetical protein KY384_007904 [Bacidia gigantensis]